MGSGRVKFHAARPTTGAIAVMGWDWHRKSITRGVLYVVLLGFGCIRPAREKRGSIAHLEQTTKSTRIWVGEEPERQRRPDHQALAARDEGLAHQRLLEARRRLLERVGGVDQEELRRLPQGPVRHRPQPSSPPPTPPPRPRQHQPKVAEAEAAGVAGVVAVAAGGVGVPESDRQPPAPRPCVVHPPPPPLSPLSKSAWFLGSNTGTFLVGTDSNHFTITHPHAIKISTVTGAIPPRLSVQTRPQTAHYKPS